MNATETAIGAQSLHIDKGKKPVIRGLTFEIKRGTITGLIGPSGSGKTTLMRAIVGVQAISSGALNVLGLRAGNKSLRERIGYVTQSPSVYGENKLSTLSPGVSELGYRSRLHCSESRICWCSMSRQLASTQCFGKNYGGCLQSLRQKVRHC